MRRPVWGMVAGVSCLTSGCGPVFAAVTGAPPASSPGWVGPPLSTRGIPSLPPGAAASMPQTSASPAAPAPTVAAAGSVVRYRLRLRDNPVDPVGARRCYAECRMAPTEQSLLECLSKCPGLEVEPGAVCGPGDGPPHAVCVTRGSGPGVAEPDPGLLLVAIIADVVIYVGLAAACARSDLSCEPFGW
jgi:hypothetical protein